MNVSTSNPSISNRASLRPWLALAFAAALMVPAAVTLAADEVLASGTWTKESFDIEGGWQIVRQGDQLFFELDEDFSTRKAPDLKLFLSSRHLAELDGKNATEGALRLAKLSSHKGAQRYEIPVGTDLGSYQTVVVHCEKYRKLWGGADL